MRTIGLIGGMSWESTAVYYRLINEGVNRRCGGLHSARILLYSVDFAAIESLQASGRWEEAGGQLAEAACRLEQAGADYLMICTNTMHKVADQVAASISVPLLHIADAAGQRIAADGLTTVGLLGTRFTMEEEFYRCRLAQRFGLRIVVPEPRDRQSIHDVIYTELCRGRILPSSRGEYQRIVSDLAMRGAQGVILGCTEISLLLRPEDSELPLYDTTALHAEMAVEAITGQQ